MKTILKYLFGIIFLLLVGYILYLFVQNRQNQGLIRSTTISVVSELRSVKLLETTQMTITKIIEGGKPKSGSGYSAEIIGKIKDVLFEDKMILQVEGIVSAGFDVGKINTGSINIDKDGFVSIDLPPAEILHVNLTENTKPYDRRLGIFTKGNITLESELRNKAISIIKDDAIKAGILDHAEISAKETLTNLLKSMNIKIKDVVIQK